MNEANNTRFIYLNVHGRDLRNKVGSYLDGFGYKFKYIFLFLNKDLIELKKIIMPNLSLFSVVILKEISMNLWYVEKLMQKLLKYKVPVIF